MRSSQLMMIGMSVFLVLGLLGLGDAIAQADGTQGPKVRWDRIEGVIVPGTASGGVNVVAGVNSVGFSWTAARGQAMVNLVTGQVMFDVNGLVLAGHVAGISAIGAPSVGVPMVKGTVVCDSLGSPSLFDTDPPVPLSAEGNSDFQGSTIPALPHVCQDAVFLIRVVNPGTGLNDRWIAHGAVRKP